MSWGGISWTAMWMMQNVEQHEGIYHDISYLMQKSNAPVNAHQWLSTYTNLEIGSKRLLWLHLGQTEMAKFCSSMAIQRSSIHRGNSLGKWGLYRYHGTQPTLLSQTRVPSNTSNWLLNDVRHTISLLCAAFKYEANGFGNTKGKSNVARRWHNSFFILCECLSVLQRRFYFPFTKE